MNPANPLAEYLQRMRQIKASGAATPETSYYGPLEALLNAVGDTLSSKAYAVIQVPQKGAGLPDGGIFEKNPANTLRSLIEIKPAHDDSWRVASGPQVTKYWNHTPLVLVTNYRDFVVVGQDEFTRRSRIEEIFRLAESEDKFWTRPISHIVQEKGAAFLEFLTAFMRRNAPITEPQDLAEQLAYYARLARQHILELQAEDLAALRQALEGVLGLHFQTPAAERLFFRSSLVQTLFYGIFSAWVLWVRDMRQEQLFDWRVTAFILSVPVMEVLFTEVAKPRYLRRLRLLDLLTLAGSALNRVDRAAFLLKFQAEQAITYFYEPFLAAFDPELREGLGVWYTPHEIVQYQVARVQRLLQEELGCQDGLADPRVFVLDPCMGTGSYLLEVARTIHRTLADKGEGGQAAVMMYEALRKRVLGFEVLTAPLVIAHLQLSRYLADEGVPLRDGERLPLYLTNALTGWRVREQELKHALAEIRRHFPDLEQELAESDRVKREEPIMVILGNPPYNAYAGVGNDEETDLVEPYKQGLNAPVENGGWGIKKFNLDDLYVRFFRLAERQIAESGRVDRGVVCYISNYSWVGAPSFVVMRQHMLGNWQQIWIDSLNGDRFRTGKRTPDGRPDESIFTTEYSREGIQVGTAIATLVRLPQRDQPPIVHFREFWGLSKTKRESLISSLAIKDFASQYTTFQPTAATRFSFRPAGGSGDYVTWPRLTDLAAVPPNNGLFEKRGFALISIDEQPLKERMQAYYDPDKSDEEIRALHPGLMTPAAGFDPRTTRKRLLVESQYRPENLHRYAFKPLDHRWAYVEPVASLWNRARPTLLAQAWKGNRFLLCRPKGVRSPEGAPFYFASTLGDNDLLTGHAYYFPIRLRTTALLNNGGQGDSVSTNLSSTAREYLARLGLDADAGDAASWVWLHVLAVGYAPQYLAEQADGLRGDWPRVPLPEDAAALQAGAALGEQIAALLDPEAEVRGVTVGTIRPALLRVGYLAEIYGSDTEREMTVDYGGTGRVEVRPRTPEEQAGLEAQAAASGISPAELAARLGGHDTCDVLWNTEYPTRPRWQNVPPAAWQYVIGGYPVLKKWLSYRHVKALGRPMAHAELRAFRDAARRVTALILLGPELNAHYERCKESAQGWGGVSD